MPKVFNYAVPRVSHFDHQMLYKNHPEFTLESFFGKNTFSILWSNCEHTLKQSLVSPFWIKFQCKFKAITISKKFFKQFLLIAVPKFEVFEGQYFQENLLLICRTPPEHENLKTLTPSNDPQKHCAY